MADWNARFTRETPERLAVLLPGLRYDCTRPLLAGAGDLLAARGYGLMRVAFHFADDAGFMAADEATQIARIHAAGAGILDAALRRGARDLVLVGKSLGTVAMAGMCPPGQARHVWLTPSLIGTGLGPVVRARGGFVLIGDRDPALEAAEALRLLPGITLARIEGADHGWQGDDGRDVLIPALEALAAWLDAAPRS